MVLLIVLLCLGSALSLASTIEDDRSNHAVQYCESDIEVLSNPSQSSIEVLVSESTHHIRYDSRSDTQNCAIMRVFSEMFTLLV